MIDQVIAMQLTKLNNGTITKQDTIEVATSNLIELLKLRQKIYSENNDVPLETIDI